VAGSSVGKEVHVSDREGIYSFSLLTYCEMHGKKSDVCASIDNQVELTNDDGCK
jgi:hypothetical protein